MNQTLPRPIPLRALLLLTVYSGVIIAMTLAWTRHENTYMLENAALSLFSAARCLKLLLAEDFHDRAVDETSIGFGEEIDNQKKFKSWNFHPNEEAPAEFRRTLEEGRNAAVSCSDEWRDFPTCCTLESSPVGNPCMACADMAATRGYGRADMGPVWERGRGSEFHFSLQLAPAAGEKEGLNA